MTTNTPSCEEGIPISRDPNNFIPADGRNVFFLNQCQIKMPPVSGNIFHIWISSAFRKGLPKITVQEDSVKLDWGEAASKFPKDIKYNKNLTRSSMTFYEMSKPNLNS